MSPHQAMQHGNSSDRHSNGLITFLTRLLEVFGVTFVFVLLCNILDLHLRDPEAGWQPDLYSIGVSFILVLVYM